MNCTKCQWVAEWTFKKQNGCFDTDQLRSTVLGTGGGSWSADIPGLFPVLKSQLLARMWPTEMIFPKHHSETEADHWCTAPARLMSEQLGSNKTKSTQSSAKLSSHEVLAVWLTKWGLEGRKRRWWRRWRRKKQLYRLTMSQILPYMFCIHTWWIGGSNLWWQQPAIAVTPTESTARERKDVNADFITLFPSHSLWAPSAWGGRVHIQVSLPSLVESL